MNVIFLHVPNWILTGVVLSWMVGVAMGLWIGWFLKWLNAGGEFKIDTEKGKLIRFITSAPVKEKEDG